MSWTVSLHDAFDAEFDALAEPVRDGLLTMMTLLRLNGPQLGRPNADTLSGSRHANLKELRFKADNGVWRVAYAFDPERQAILLVAGDKTGVAQRRFHKRLVATADRRMDEHLAILAVKKEI